MLSTSFFLTSPRMTFFGTRETGLVPKPEGKTEMAKYPSELAERLQIRLPEGLRDRIKASANQNGRSMNSELVIRLEASFEASSALAPSIAQAIDDHIEREVAARLRAIAATLSAA